jgi:ATP-dependent RNA helicase DHX8/PRP22
MLEKMILLKQSYRIKFLLLLVKQALVKINLKNIPNLLFEELFFKFNYLGKTTQLTQYLVEAGFALDRCIGCTQPRRMAVFSVAKRVAEECKARLGDFVGYKIRFEDCTTHATCIKYMTDGILLRECLSDQNLDKYSVIILDEAHERTADTDILMGLLRAAVKRRSNLKLIISSATLNSAKFSEYFYNAPVFEIGGRAYPVEKSFSLNDVSDYFKEALQKVLKIHLTENYGDILLFLTGQEEIERACEYLEEALNYLGSRIPELVVIPVYSALPADLQTKIFEAAPNGGRKVIIATNIAETSLTVDGVVYVIDPGFMKQKIFNPRTGMDSLVIAPISQATAKQRAGRAGRTGPGICYRLYTQQSFDGMLKTTVPEIQRTNLASSVLKLKVMGINDVSSFELMDPPSSDAVFDAMKQLFLLNALDEKGAITEEGIQMAQLPLDPNLSKMFLKSRELKCTDEIATIVAMLSVQNIFFNPRKKRQIAKEKKLEFNHIGGDHLTLLEVYKKCERVNFNKQWCRENFVQVKTLLEARDIRDHLLNIMEQKKIEIVSAGINYERIQKAVCAGFIHHAARKGGSKPHLGYIKLVDQEKVFIHPSSSLFSISPSW